MCSAAGPTRRRDRTEVCRGENGGTYARFFCQHQILAGKDSCKILNQSLVKGTGTAAGIQQIPDVKEKNFAVAGGGHSHLQRTSGAGVGFREQLAGFRFSENGAVAPEILFDNMNLPGEDQSYGREQIAGAADKFVFPAGNAPGRETGQDAGNFFLFDLSEQGSGL